MENLPSKFVEQALLGVRPETIRIASSGKGSVLATVVSLENLGAETVLGFMFSNEKKSGSLFTREDRNTYFAKIDGSVSLVEGDEVFLTIHSDNIRWFDSESGLTIHQKG
jgi:multiple sugar transport system ATP-binding protein